MTFLRKLLGRTPMKPRPAVRETAKRKASELAELKRFAVEHRDPDLLGYVESRERALRALEKEYDLLTGGR